MDSRADYCRGGSEPTSPDNIVFYAVTDAQDGSVRVTANPPRVP
jgi:hypothetical protein